jgi:hypothetical protein
VIDANPDSVKIMTAMDRMTPPMRALVHDYGFAIVYAMINDGYRDARALRPILETRRKRLQQETLDAPCPRNRPFQLPSRHT